MHTIFSHTFTHSLSPPPLFFLPSPTPLQPLKLIIGRSWLVGLSGPLICFLEVFAILAQKCSKTFFVVFVSLVFSRFLQLCQSKQYQLLIFSCFLFSCFLGSRDKFSPWQTSIGTAFTPPHFILSSLLSYWFWLLSHQRKCTVKTALSPTSSGTPLDWCFTGMPRFWFLIFKGLARVLQTWNH